MRNEATIGDIHEKGTIVLPFAATATAFAFASLNPMSNIVRIAPKSWASVCMLSTLYGLVKFNIFAFMRSPNPVYIYEIQVVMNAMQMNKHILCRLSSL